MRSAISWARRDVSPAVKDFVYSWQLPIAGGVAVVLWCADFTLGHGCAMSRILGPVRAEVYPSLATIFGALFGFVITAFSIVVGLGGKVFQREAGEDGVFHRVAQAFAKTIKVIGTATIVAVIAIVVDNGSRPNIVCEYIVVFFSAWATISVAGAIWILELLLK